MANEVVSLSQTSPYQLQSQELDRRQRMADLLRQQSFQPLEAGSYNGIQAPISPAAGLAKMLQMAIPAMQDKRISEERKELVEKATAERRGDLSDILAALKGMPAQSEIPGMVSATAADVEDRDFMANQGASPMAIGQQLPTMGGYGEGENVGKAAQAAVPGGSAAMYAAMMKAKSPGFAEMGLQGEAARQAAADARLLKLQDDAAKLQGQKDLKLSPDAPQAGRDTPLTPDVLAQRIAVAQAGAAVPPGYQPAPGGGLAPTPGGPHDRTTQPLNEGQSKSATYADRMDAANLILGDPKVSAAALDLTEHTKRAVPGGNYLVSEDYQKYDQAARDFVNAVLRQESGAAISPSEFDNAKKQYFPQPGDGPDVLAQKAENRERAISGMARGAGPAYKRPEAPKDKPTTSAPTPEEARAELERRRKAKVGGI